uniref:CS domain-containing protein n=1 Tax=Tetranychus urticae TaxID=32264 RepID=T1KV54_TETUR
MTQSMLLPTVLCILVVLELTATDTPQWRLCLDDSCPIKHLDIPYKQSSTCSKGKSGCFISADAPFNGNSISFELEVVETGQYDRLNEIYWGQNPANVLFNCDPVVTTTAHGYFYPKINGNAIYINGEAYCSWSLDMNNSSFPFELIDQPQYYISQSGYQIYYNLNQTVPVAAANYSQLPKSVEPFVKGYKYKAVGSEKYLLIAREASDTTDFLLKVNGEDPRLVRVNLKSEISIDIDCNFKERSVKVHYKYGQPPYEFKEAYYSTIDESECRWSLSDPLKSNYGIIKPRKTVYELQIIENNMFVYFDEANFKIETPTSASSSSTLAKSLLVIKQDFESFKSL